MPAFFKNISASGNTQTAIKMKTKERISKHNDILFSKTHTTINILSIFANQINNMLKTKSYELPDNPERL